MNIWKVRFSCVLLSFALSFGCAAPARTGSAPSSPVPAGSCNRVRDQQSILAMAGSYDVEFDFEETEALTRGYEKHPSHKSFGTELVVVVENTPGRVSLQHLLQLGDGPDATVIKHWRQDWAFENRELFEFRGREVWQRRSLPADAVACTWSQAVYGVDDAPRYSGFGSWRYADGRPVWTSNETWRPLPRREYSTRSDYDVLVAVNRHRITSDGWEHEQDNSKLVLEPRHFLVRERGLNRYSHTTAADTQAAAIYWQATAPFWKEVREEWARVFTRVPYLNLRSEADGKRLHEALFARAESKLPVDEGTRAFIRQTLQRYVVQSSAAAGSTAAR